MRYLQETTDWGSHNTPNHIYYVNDSKTKMVGYIKAGTKALFKFSKPMMIDVRGRKFVELKNKKAESDEVYFGKPVAETKPKDAIEVQGSNGKVYLLTKNSFGKYSCTCPGFTFRHTCKHIQDVK
jgi:hypothetical protein